LHSAVADTYGRRIAVIMPPEVIASMKQENTSPVGKLVPPLLLLSGTNMSNVGTHIKTKEYTAPSKKAWDRPKHIIDGEEHTVRNDEDID
jgi:hypothetical protein